jgi:Holliday junction resolvase-like predicted endonuclease
MSVNSHLYTKKMKLCVMLLNRIIDDNYLFNVYKYHDEKWGDLDMIFNDDNSIHIYRPKVITEEDKIQERKEDKILRKREDYLQKQDINFLFDTMKKHILTWWD